MKRKLPKNASTIAFFIFVFILISVFVFIILRALENVNKKQNYYVYKGKLIEFRRPVIDSYKILVLPNESSLNFSTYLLSLGIFKNLSFVIFENDNNEATALQTFEIGTKVLGLLRHELGIDLEVGVNVVKIEKDLSEVDVSDQEYYIFLKSFLLSNESYVKVHRHNFVEITGRNLEEFDLATIRFLIYFLENMKQLYK